MKNQIRYSVKAIILLLILLVQHSSGFAKNNDIVENLVKTNPVRLALKSSSIFAGRGDGITTCPVTGEKIKTKKHKMDLYGRTVYFCCHGCLKAAKTTPDKFVKPTEAEQKQAVTRFLAKAQAVQAEEICNE